MNTIKGWKLVPIEPTRDMVAAGNLAMASPFVNKHTVIGCYREMIEAAPAFIGMWGEDLSKCPQCGGEADRGIDPCIPPSAYMCSKCCAKETMEKYVVTCEVKK